MRVYITDLEAYNNGHLVGSWYTLPMDEKLLAESVENELSRGKEVCNSVHQHEEYFITDFECSYMEINEYDSLTKLNNIAQKMEELEEQEIVAVKLLLENGLAADIDNAIEHIEDMFCTNETSMEDIAYTFIEETYALQEMPESLQRYFNYEALGRDIEIESSFHTDDDGILWEYVA